MQALSSAGCAGLVPPNAFLPGPHLPSLEQVKGVQDSSPAENSVAESVQKAHTLSLCLCFVSGGQ